MRRLTIEDLVRREPRPEPWSEGEKIPWHEPGFSERMLAEHLSQGHGLASRQLDVVERQADWLVSVCGLEPGARVLDLGCGPGLYTSALARRGMRCRGIDFSPASIAHARRVASAEELACEYVEADMRSADFGVGFALVSLIFGEFNAFRRVEARSILERSRRALAPGGRVVIEAHTLAAVERIGGGVRGDEARSGTWVSAAGGLFSERPHVRLYESFWNRERRAATERYYVIDAATAGVTAYAQSMQGYDDLEYEALFAEAGLRILERFGSLEGDEQSADGDFVVLLAEAASGVT